ncbi:hypothetical protein J4219_00830 [Candidatus Woesearchaeota archaeon]|nr:hypothetical protein [Candidatus Woesearchaeota archaeon]
MKKALFSLIVTFLMNSLDVIYHLLTHTAVHLNYVAVKFTVIFLVVYLVSRHVGIGLQEGIVSALAGPMIFYMYYVAATPTLDRTLFVLDENVGYVLVHSAALFIAYWFMLVHVLKEPADFPKKQFALLFGVIGAFYLFTPFTFLEQTGLHLELTASQSPFLGLFLLLLGLTLFIVDKYDLKYNLIPAFFAALLAALFEVGAHMLLRTLGLVNELHVFSSFAYVFVILVATMIVSSAWLSSRTTAALSLLTAVLLEIAFFNAAMPSNPLFVALHTPIIYLSQAILKVPYE